MRARRIAPVRYAVIGTGLIGASMGLALRRAYGSAVTITGWDSDPRALRTARKRKAITRTAASAVDAAASGDVVVLAAPLEAIVQMLPAVIAAAPRGALVVDVAGVKRPVVKAARTAQRARPDIAFVACHPLAGREVAGAAHADGALFEGRPFALISDGASAAALRRVERIVRRLGATPVRLRAAEHDRIVASTSALPQLAAVALALAVAAEGPKAGMLAGPGFSSSSRLAASPYSVWAGALAANRAAIVKALGRLSRALDDVQAAARQSEGRPMERLFRRAAAARRRVAGD